jgi:DNA gyrase subunit A
VLVTADGWVKRQKEINPETTRSARGGPRAGAGGRQHAGDDRLLQQLRHGLLARIIDIPATTGYGEPIQKLFKLKDGERIIAPSPLTTASCRRSRPRSTRNTRTAAPKTHGLAVTSDGYALRFGSTHFREVSTKSGRRSLAPAEGARVTRRRHRRQGNGHRRQPKSARAALQER